MDVFLLYFFSSQSIYGFRSFWCACEQFYIRRAEHSKMLQPRSVSYGILNKYSRANNKKHFPLKILPARIILNSVICRSFNSIGFFALDSSHRHKSAKRDIKCNRINLACTLYISVNKNFSLSSITIKNLTP